MTDNQRSHIKEQKLQPSGSSDGVSVHINTETADKLNLNENVSVDINLINDNGEPKIQLSNLPTGFSEHELLEFADDNSLEIISSNDKTMSDEPDFWGYTFRSEKDVRVSMEERSHINNQLCNNIFIETGEIRIDSVDEYKTFRSVCERHDGFDITIHDSDGMWQRASVSYEVEEIPKDKTMGALIDKTDWVSVSLVFVGCSLQLTLDGIKQIIENAEDAIEEIK